MSQIAFFPTPKAKPMLIRDLPETERPVYRLHSLGVGGLSNIELLAAILQTPDALQLAGRLFVAFADWDGLVSASKTALEQIDGVGPAIAGRIHASIESGRRATVEKHSIANLIVRRPTDVALHFLASMKSLTQEHFVVACLNTGNKLVHDEVLYKGQIDKIYVRTAEVFGIAIQHMARSIIVIHNHPSGNPQPSAEDIAVTEELVKAGELLDIEVLDHIIIGGESFISLKERNVGGLINA